MSLPHYRTLVFALLCGSVAQAQNQTSSVQTLPIKPTRTIAFTTDEGTWISLDVAPDGNTIVFDLVGDLYAIPITGGKATPLTRGIAYDVAPRFSPDGKRIAFLSDRSGRNQLWTINADGSGARQVTRDPESMSAPEWSRDGRSLVAPRGDVEADIVLKDAMFKSVWRYDAASGAGAVMIASNGRMTSGAFDPQGTRYYYGAINGYKPGVPYDYRFRLKVYDVVRRDTATISTPDGNGARPIVSPDGRSLVYLAEQGQGEQKRIVLRKRELSAGRAGTDAVLAEIDRYIANSFMVPIPGYAFTPDSRAVILSSGGRIVRVDIANGRVTPIPFTAQVRAELGPRATAKPKPDLADAPMQVRQLRSVNVSPDGKRVVFSAVGKVWLMELGKTPTRLTRSTLREYSPVFSPDGRWIAFATWSDRGEGQVWKVAAEGGLPIPLAKSAAQYRTLRWTPDGARLVFVTISDSMLLSRYVGGHRKLVGTLEWVASTGGPTHRITATDECTEECELTLSGDGRRVYYVHEMALKSVGLDGNNARTELHFTHQGHELFELKVTPSPDGKWVAMQADVDVYIAPLPPAQPGGNAPTIDVGRHARDSSVIVVTKDGGLEPKWSSDGQWFSWSRANLVFRARLADVIRKAGAKPQQIAVSLKVPRQGGSGKLLLRGGRVITMAARGIQRTPTGDGGERVVTDPMVIERGDVLIDGRRIVAVGQSGAITVPADATVVDVSGKTIIPGLIDLHADSFGRWLEYPYGTPDMPAFLAYGITTARNPGNGSIQHLVAAEQLEAGDLIGSRSFNIAQMIIVDVMNLEQAQDIIRAYRNVGADFIKTKSNKTDRAGRQWIALASASQGMMVTTHWHEGTVLDGYTGAEHWGPLDRHPIRINRDFVELWARAKIDYTPTLMLLPSTYAPTVIVPGQPFVSQIAFEYDRCIDAKGAKEQRLVAPNQRGPSRWGACTGHPTLAPASRAVAEGARDVLRAGGNVAVSSHGRGFDGVIGTHYEIWIMVMGGMTPAEALWAATLNGARGLDLEADLGSIEVGKLADLVVLNSNPLENIRNTMDIQYVLKNGEMYDDETLDVIWPAAKKFPGLPWWSKN